MVILVMGVAGSGKTTVGQLLAEELGWQFRDADDFHPPANIVKMSRGAPLDDHDRAPWLAAMHDALVAATRAERNVVLACSALKSAYRKQLSAGLEMRTVFLQGGFPLIFTRLHERRGHYAKSTLLASQFKDLEEPAEAVRIEVSLPPGEIVRRIRASLEL